MGKTAFMHGCHSALVDEIASGTLPPKTIAFDVIDCGAPSAGELKLHPDEMAQGPMYGAIKSLFRQLIADPSIQSDWDTDGVQNINANFNEVWTWFNNVCKKNNPRLVLLLDNTDRLSGPKMAQMNSFLDTFLAQGKLAEGRNVVVTASAYPPRFDDVKMRVNKVKADLSPLTSEQLQALPAYKTDKINTTQFTPDLLYALSAGNPGIAVQLLKDGQSTHSLQELVGNYANSMEGLFISNAYNDLSNHPDILLTYLSLLPDGFSYDDMYSNFQLLNIPSQNGAKLRDALYALGYLQWKNSDGLVLSAGVRRIMLAKGFIENPDQLLDIAQKQGQNFTDKAERAKTSNRPQTELHYQGIADRYSSEIQLLGERLMETAVDPDSLVRFLDVAVPLETLSLH